MASKVQLEERTHQLEDVVDRAQQPMRQPRFLLKGCMLLCRLRARLPKTLRRSRDLTVADVHKDPRCLPVAVRAVTANEL